MITWIPADHTVSDTIAYAILDQYQLAIFTTQGKYGYELFYDGTALVNHGDLESVEEAKRAAFKEYQRADATGVVLLIKTNDEYQDGFMAMDAQFTTNKKDAQAVTFWAESYMQPYQLDIIKPDQQWAIIDGSIDKTAVIRSITVEPNRHYALLLPEGSIITGFTPHTDLSEHWNFVCMSNNLGVIEMLYYHTVNNEIIIESARF